MRIFDQVKIIPFGLTLLFAFCSKGLFASEDPLFRYGVTMNDTSTAPNDDEASIRFTLAEPMKFFRETVTDFYQNTNGLVSFSEPYGKYRALPIPTKDVPAMIAVYWTDIDTREGGTNTNNLYARNWTVAEDLDLATDIIANATGNSDFVPTSTAVITYNRVNAFSRNTTVENTFQLVMAWNSEESWAIMQYTRLRFFEASSSAASTLIGFNDRFGTKGYLIRNISDTAGMQDHRTGSSNSGLPGVETDTGVSGLYCYQMNGPGANPGSTDNDVVGNPIDSIVDNIITSPQDLMASATEFVGNIASIPGNILDIINIEDPIVTIFEFVTNLLNIEITCIPIEDFSNITSNITADFTTLETSIVSGIDFFTNLFNINITCISNIESTLDTDLFNNTNTTKTSGKN